MKYVVVLGDGMADEPLEALGGATPLEAAATPAMDALASAGRLGMVRTVPPAMKPGSDVANLAVMGYDPAIYYSGRSPLEALSVGVAMEKTDVVFRCNLVTVTEEEPYAQKTILDHSSGEISTEDADILMDAVREAFNTDSLQFFTGTSYRHIALWKHGSVLELEPPHDHLGSVIGAYLPENEMLRSIMERSFAILNNHPLNLQRAAEGKNKANSLWFWGAGTKPQLQNFEALYGVRGLMISAVDLLKGIAVGAGMDTVEIPGANGSLHTNYQGKANAAIDGLLRGGYDLAYIHLEGPDEMGHQGSMENKLLSIEYLDSRIVAPVVQALTDAGEDFRMLILPDHPTPIRCRTHTSDPVPFVLYDSTRQQRKTARYCEREAAAAGWFIEEGHTLMGRFLNGQ